VTDKVKAFISKLGLWVKKIEGKNFGHIFSFEGFCGGNSVETTDTGINQCIKEHLLNLQSRFSVSIFQKYSKTWL
jgi:hypothetical protein